MTAITHATVTDAELLLAYARHRSPDAFSELVRRYAALVYHVGWRITRNREDAADVAQECFLQLAAQAGKVANPLPAWLHTLARSRAIDLIRRRSARQRHEQQTPPPRESALSLEQWETLRSPKPLTRNDAEIQSLRWAIALWDETAAATSKTTDPSQLLTGSKAYAKWLEFLQQQADGVGPGQDAWDNNLMIHLRYNRAAAAAYLREVAANQPAIAQHLLAAADLYQQVLDEATSAPFWGQFNANPEIRPQKLKDYTNIVRQASQFEAQAIDEIRQAIPRAAGTH